MNKKFILFAVALAVLVFGVWAAAMAQSSCPAGQKLVCAPCASDSTNCPCSCVTDTTGGNTTQNTQNTYVQNLIAQIRAQIAQLQAQLQQLLSQQNDGQTWCHTFNNNLKIGDGGMAGGGRSPDVIDNDVVALKQTLNKENLYDLNVDQPGTAGSSIKATMFNKELSAAVVAFQEKYTSEILEPYGLKHGTGFVGKATRKKLNALYGCAIKTACNPNWTCGWGECKNGYQSQIPVDSNNCGVSYHLRWVCPLIRACAAGQAQTVCTAPDFWGCDNVTSGTPTNQVVCGCEPVCAQNLVRASYVAGGTWPDGSLKGDFRCVTRDQLPY